MKLERVALLGLKDEMKIHLEDSSASGTVSHNFLLYCNILVNNRNDTNKYCQYLYMFQFTTPLTVYVCIHVQKIYFNLFKKQTQTDTMKIHNVTFHPVTEFCVLQNKNVQCHYLSFCNRYTNCHLIKVQKQIQICMSRLLQKEHEHTVGIVRGKTTHAADANHFHGVRKAMLRLVTRLMFTQRPLIVFTLRPGIRH